MMLLSLAGVWFGWYLKERTKEVESRVSSAERSLRASGIEAVSHLERQTKTTSSIRHVYAEFDRDEKDAKSRQA